MRDTLRVAVAVVLVTAALGGVTPAAAQADCTLDATTLGPLVDEYNANVDQVPGMARGQIADERIDVQVNADGGERHFYAVTDADGRITEFSAGEGDDPSLRVIVDEQAMCDVLASDDPAAAFQTAYDSGEIDVQGVGVVNSVKIGLVKVGVGIAQWLSDLF